MNKNFFVIAKKLNINEFLFFFTNPFYSVYFMFVVSNVLKFKLK